jgi:hypothetical protein
MSTLCQCSLVVGSLFQHAPSHDQAYGCTNKGEIRSIATIMHRMTIWFANECIIITVGQIHASSDLGPASLLVLRLYGIAAV